MDSVTQIALGAAVGEAVIGRKIGGRAALAGAICGTLPDLDSFIPYADAVASVTYHRSFSHSLLVLTLVTPVLAWGLGKLMRIPPELARRWWLAVFLMLVTHPVLDAFTVYGTQLLWPIWVHPVSWSTIFIIDPAYTLPLALGVLVALFTARTSRARVVANTAGLALSSAYLGWTVMAKFHVENQMRTTLAERGIVYERLLSTPAPFNTILWRFVIMAEGGYYEGYLSVSGNSDDALLEWYPDEKQELASLLDAWPVQRLQWFTHGFYSVRTSGEELVMADLRMGLEPNYAFMYSIAHREGAIWVLHPGRQVSVGWDQRQVQEVLSGGVNAR